MQLFTNIVAAVLAMSPIIFANELNDEKAIARPTAKGMVGISLKEFNDFRRGQTDGLRYAGDYCYLEAMRSDALVSTKRDVEADFRKIPTDTEVTYDLQVKEGIRLTIGIYEKCQKTGDEKLTGSLVVASRGGKLLWVEEHEILPVVLLPTRNTALARLGFCFYCGAVSELYFDPANRKFYTQYIGD